MLSHILFFYLLSFLCLKSLFWQQHGMDTEHTSTMVRTWKSRGYVYQISVFKKCIKMLPRGIRNNNPQNIRRTAKDEWKGLRAQQTDVSFCQFESLEYGWRAAFYLLTRTYYHKYRLFTIRAIISKWAPPNENLTSTYIANVSRLTGIPPDEPIGIPSDQPARWMAVGIAMAIQENGTDSLDYFAMLRGWELARS